MKSDNNYPREAFKYLFQVESKHFWFIGRNKIIENCVRRVYRSLHGKLFLEVGCGTGFVLAALERMGFVVTGLDMHAVALTFAAKRTKARLICADMRDYHAYGRFDIVGAFDVVEHVVNDGAFIAQCAKFLKPHGALMITVPAGMEVWTDFDRFSGHKRRYSKATLQLLLESHGFNVTFIQYFGFFQYLPHLIAKKYVSSDVPGFLHPPVYVINMILQWSMIIESKLMYYLSFPFGTSLIAVAKKRNRHER